MNKNLVILRAGDKSLHPQWLDHKIPRNWDLAVSYYGNKDNPYAGEYDFLHRFKGSKWEGISDFCQNNQELIDKYDYIWLPDDDLFTTCKNINEFFEICNAEQFNLAQPALTISSYYSHHITLQHPFTKYRLTNFVEVMAPCFSVNLFNKITNTFSLNTSGWGLEWIWLDVANKNKINKFAIVDKTPIIHTRPVSSAGSGGARNSPENEMMNLLNKHGISKENMRNISFASSETLIKNFLSVVVFFFLRVMLKLYRFK